MNASASLHLNKEKQTTRIKYPQLNKIKFDKRIKGLQLSQEEIRNGQGRDASVDPASFLVMRENFDKLYSKIQQLSHKDDYVSPQQKPRSCCKEFNLSELSFKVISSPEKADNQVLCKMRTSLRQNQSSSPERSHELEINTVSEGEISKQKGEYSLAQAFLRRSRYNKKLLPLRANKMSNNIKDYLSVERITIKDIETSLLTKSSFSKRYHLSNLFDSKEPDPRDTSPNIKEVNLSPKKEVKVSPQFRRFAKFKPPFQLYYYRDFLWKVAFSNENVLVIPEEYREKVKFYVGGGNNSNLIKGLMKRRTWFQLTDKVQEAQFAWTQIKVPSIFASQPKGEKDKRYSEEELLSLRHSSQDINCSKKVYSLFNEIEQESWNEYWTKNMELQRKMKPHLRNRSKKFKVTEIPLEKRGNTKVHNHFCNNFLIGNKKALFQIMSEYYTSRGIDVFERLPLTFHVKNGLEDDQFLKFLQIYFSIAKANKNCSDSINKYNAWIVKPGQNTNRGNGITVCLDLSEIKSILKSKSNHRDGTLKTYILQKYIERPLLYKKRKFDLRHYMMISCSNSIMKGYWYRHGYVRTTSSEYTLKANGGGIHLTNDAVQKYLPDYGRYEKANKITYEELDAFVKKQDPQFDFYKMVYPKMKQLATDAIHASALNIDPERRVGNFEVFGLDFMIDEAYNVWLIEINTNPCLETNCQVLNQIIPQFIENTLQICIDPLFPPPLNFEPKSSTFLENTGEENNYELIFDERIDGVHNFHSEAVNHPEDDDAIFDDDGQDFAQEMI